MQTEKIACNACGAPLQVLASTQFAICNHCGSQLHIERTESTTFTTIMDRLTTKTEELSDRLDSLTSQNEVAELDRDWDVERRKYLVVVGKHGNTVVPTKIGSIVAALFAVAFGTVWTTFTSVVALTMVSSSLLAFPVIVFPLAGIAILVSGIHAGITGVGKAEGYKRAEAQYHRRRAELRNPHR
jgi:hypothetical protein